MFDFITYHFMQNALVAGVLVSIACGVVGSLVVVNRLSFLSGGVAHAAYGGLGLAAFLRWPPMIGAVIFSIVSSIGMGYVSRQNKQRADTVIGVMWAAGMAFGVIMIDLTKGYYIDLMSYLFGSILAVPDSNIVFMGVMDVIIVATIGFFYKELLGMSYDEEFASISGVPVTFLYFLLLILISFAVVMLMKVVGLILVIALFTIPASIAEMFTKDLKRVMALACALGMVFTTGGLLLSYFLNLTSGATIIMVSVLVYGITWGVRKKRVKVIKSRPARRPPGQ